MLKITGLLFSNVSTDTIGLFSFLLILVTRQVEINVAGVGFEPTAFDMSQTSVSALPRDNSRYNRPADFAHHHYDIIMCDS